MMFSFISFILLHEIYYMRYTCLTITTKIKFFVLNCIKKIKYIVTYKNIKLKK